MKSFDSAHDILPTFSHYAYELGKAEGCDECFGYSVTIFIEFDALIYYKKTCMVIHLCIKFGSLAKQCHIRKGKYSNNFVTRLYHFYENLPEKSYSQTLTLKSYFKLD